MFDDFELSARRGKPAHLFLFGRQANAWRFIGADRDWTIGGKTYLAAPIARSEIKQTVEKPQDQITITFPYNRDPADTNPVTQSLGDNWFPYTSADVITVICMAVHLNDPDLQPVVEWMGQVGQPKFTDGQLELTCVPTSDIGKARRQGAKWQIGCWKTVYSTGIRGCNLLPDGIPVAGTLTAVSGNTVTAAEFVAQTRPYVGGNVQWTDTGNVVHTTKITAYAGTTLTLDDATGLAVGAIVTAHTKPFDLPATLTAVAGLTLTAPEFATSEFNLAGGALRFTRPDGIVERLSIMTHTGSTITVLSGAAALAVGLNVIGRPGCERTWAACNARGNTINYGGAIYKPVQNPYNGTSMSWG